MSLILPLNLEICCVTSLENRPAGLLPVRPAPSQHDDMYPETRTWRSDTLHVRLAAHCTSRLNPPGPLSSGALYLNLASVWRHITASQHCHAADLGYLEIHVEARAGDSDVMAGGGAAGSPPDVRHQPPGDALPAGKRGKITAQR